MKRKVNGIILTLLLVVPICALQAAEDKMASNFPGHGEHSTADVVKCESCGEDIYIYNGVRYSGKDTALAAKAKVDAQSGTMEQQGPK